MSNQLIIDALSPVLQRVKSLDLFDSVGARATLEKEFPLAGELGDSLRALADAGLRDGWLCDREAGAAKFSRVAKPDAAQGFSIDAVLLSGDGPAHRHIKGEVNCLLALEGEPEFCGYAAGWAVFPPGSAHVPGVTGGRMIIFYMLPDGAVEWQR